MAANRFCSCHLIVIALVFLLTRYGSALHVETSPHIFTPLIHDQLNVTCIADSPDFWAREIVIMEMKRDEQLIAVLKKHELTMGPGSRSDIKADGHIVGGGSQSYLTVIINNPSINDFGVYSCITFYLDDQYQLKEDTAFFNVSTTDKDIPAVITYLVGKVTLLEKTVREQNDELNTMKDQDNDNKAAVHLLTDKLERQTKLIEKIMDFQNASLTYWQNNDIDNRVNHLERSIQTLTEADKENEAKVKMFDETIIALNNTLERQKVLLANQENRINIQNTSITVRNDAISIQINQLFDCLKQLKEDYQKDDGLVGNIMENLMILNKTFGNLKGLIDKQDYAIQLQNTSLETFHHSYDIMINKLQNSLKDVEERSSYQCAFACSYNMNDKLVAGDTLLFSIPITNVGNAYDVKTGIFTAPRDGIYVFLLIVLTHDDGQYINLSLLVNTREVTKLFIESFKSQDQAPMSIVLQLGSGDTVRPRINNFRGVDIIYGAHSVFTGFLLSTI